ncbi:MAG: hypothetical protein AB7Q29_14985 [Vicinamibacterales bacterium]
MHDRPLTVVAGSAREARCRRCRARILWVTRAAGPGLPARALPFDAPAPLPLRVERTDRGVVFEVWPRLALHFDACERALRRRASRRRPALAHAGGAHAE